MLWVYMNKKLNEEHISPYLLKQDQLFYYFMLKLLLN